MKYIDYLKDNPEGYWFKRKVFGWGWTPATWHGWALTIVLMALVVLNAIRLDALTATDAEMASRFIPQTILLVILFTLIAWKTGEKPRWQWGIKDAERKSAEEHSVQKDS